MARALCTLVLVAACSSSQPAPAGGGQTDAVVFAPDLGTPALPDAGKDVPALDTDEPPDECPDFNTPCTQNEDCECGWCVEGPNGHVCTQPCIDECPFGFLCKQAPVGGQDIIFLCAPIVQKLCEPCLSDDQCPGGTCQQIGEDDKTWCTALCGDGGTCPEGYECITTTGANSQQCWPTLNTCSCTPDSAGAQRTCSAINEYGTCDGWETCDPEVGWVDCNAKTPAEEICDGADNDCDGLADDGLEDTQPCQSANDHGICHGLQRCLGGLGWICDASEPGPEVCDFQDNDCNGGVDDPFQTADGVYDTIEHCGTCNNACEGKYAFAESVLCDTSGASPLCIVDTCLPGYFKLGDFQCIVPPDAACKPCGSDADCFGNDCINVQGADYCAPPCVDDAECDGPLTCLDGHCLPANGSCDCDEATQGAKKSCEIGNPLGTCFGFQTCDATAGWSACDALVPAEEACDGIDSDCNGVIDDALEAPDCEKQKGVCQGSKKQCGGGAGWLPCGTSTLPATYEPVELTCDGLDNDCDGGADDKDTDGDGYLDKACGGDDCDDLNPLANPGAAEICGDGVDNDCDGAAENKDADADGVIDAACGGGDCNDTSTLAKPGLAEVCGDALDNDCDGSIDNKDIDGDSFLDPACGGTDCNDLEKTVHPGAAEVCNGFDNDCNDLVDDKDEDGDGHFDDACPNGDDCDDDDVFIHPGAKEICGDIDGDDEDCSGAAGDKDLDQDGFVDADPTCLNGTDCDDLDPLVFPNAIEIYDVKDTDCDGLVDEGLVPPGTIVISEIMKDPKAVGDGFGEWFEVVNVGILPVNLASWVISDENTPTSDKFTLPATAPVLVPPGGAVVLCRNSDPALNGGVQCAAGYDDYILAQKGDEVILSLDGLEIDRVVYKDDADGWPKGLPGVSFSLDPNQLSKAGNDVAGNWCLTPADSGKKLPGGDKGSPGQINPSCSGLPAVTSVAPADGVDNGGELVTLTGSGFIGVNAVTLAGNPCAAFEVVDDNTITCVTPPGTASDADVVVVKGALTATLEDGYRYTGEAVTAVDFCALQWPTELTAPAGEPSGLTFGQVHAPGVTPAAGAPAGIGAQVGFGPLGSDPRNDPGWIWTAAVWHKQFFANDEFQQTLTVATPGQYGLAWRFTDDGGYNYMVCDFDPGTADGFKIETLGTLVVY